MPSFRLSAVLPLNRQSESITSKMRATQNNHQRHTFRLLVLMQQGENNFQLPSKAMIAALRNRNYDEFAQLLEEKSDENNVESEEVSAEVSAALQSLRAAVYGARGAIGGSSSIKAIIKCINVFSSSIDIVGHGLNILYYLVDHPPNCQQALDNGIVPVIILAMKTFVDDKKIQSNACGIIWVSRKI